MPKIIIVNIPMMYQCVLHVQNMSLTPAASTVLILALLYSLLKLLITYIITSVMIRVISVALNINMSARKLFRNDLNIEFYSGLSNSCSFLFRVIFLFRY